MYFDGNFRHKLNFSLILVFLLGIGLACNFEAGSDDRNSEPRAARQTSEKTVAEDDSAPRKIESYTVKGFKFSYYLIPAGLSRDELIAAAQRLHDKEPDAQLILVDDDSRLADYVNYAKEFSKGNTEAKLPKEWAQRHIVANVQKYASGKFKLCESYGYKEIAELK